MNMSDFSVQKVWFCAFQKKAKTSFMSYLQYLSHQKRTQLSEKDFDLISHDKVNCSCQSSYDKIIINQIRNSHSDQIITPNSNKNDFLKQL